MLGNLLSLIREKKGLSKTNIAETTGINVGHLTHIEKGERNPSQNALKNICKALDTPYQPLLYTYGKTVSEEQETYGFIDYIPYNKVIAIDSIDKLMDCPSTAPSSSLAIKMQDASMETSISKDAYAFIEFNTLLNNKDIGLFFVNDHFVIRRFFSKKGIITLKADNKDFPDIKVDKNDSFYIIGKVVN